MILRKNKLGWLFGLAFVFVFASLFLPTYTIDAYDCFIINDYPFGSSYKIDGGSDFTFIWEAMSRGANLAIGLYLAILICIILSLVFIPINYLSLYESGKEGSSKQRDLMWVNLGLTALPPFLFFVLHHMLDWFETGEWYPFAGKDEFGEWYPNAGWYLQIAAFSVILLAMVLLRLTKGESDEDGDGMPGSSTNEREAVSLPLIVVNGGATDSMTEMRYCSKCGKVIPSDSVLCPYCGEKVMR